MPDPTALIIGDSISMGYTPPVQEKLAGEVAVVRHDGNGGTSANVLEHVAEWVAPVRPDVVHFNAGLHDLARDEGADGPNRVPIEQYEANLRGTVAWLQGNTEAALIFATTTGVIDEWHAERKGFVRTQDDVRRYNEVARAVMDEKGVAIDDLFAVVENAGRETCLKPDGVHMVDKGNDLLSDAVAASIRRALRAE